MPVNRNALIRYRSIDKTVSMRTIRLDLNAMRSDKLGYNAPIVVTDKKYYRYEDSDYSITNIPLTSQDLHILQVMHVRNQRSPKNIRTVVAASIKYSVINPRRVETGTESVVLRELGQPRPFEIFVGDDLEVQAPRIELRLL